MTDLRLSAELLRRAAADQAARARILHGDPEEIARCMAIDADNTSWLKTVLEAVGWPGNALVGEDAAHAAWLLAQHADRDPDVQRDCLAAMTPAVAAGDASAGDLAYLTDRVLVNGGRPQRYGTQLTPRDGRYVAERLEDASHVDAARAAVGLDPLDTYISRATREFGDPVPVLIRCRGCGDDVRVWPPAPGEASTGTCSSCGRDMTVRAYLPGTGVPPGVHRLSPEEVTRSPRRARSRPGDARAAAPSSPRRRS